MPQPTEVVVQVATAGVATATEFAMLLPANGVLGVCLTLGIIKLSANDRDISNDTTNGAIYQI